MTEAPIDAGSLPDVQTLRTLELQSRQHSSGVGTEALVGTWVVWQVWGKTNNQPSAASGVLRALAGTLSIERGKAEDLTLLNSVTIGLLKLRFSGPGHLRQRRPLLVFHFLKLDILFAEKVILSFPLPIPPARKEPFFALIATGNTASGLGWLAARGRGGGLALWVRQATLQTSR